MNTRVNCAAAYEPTASGYLATFHNPNPSISISKALKIENMELSISWFSQSAAIFILHFMYSQCFRDCFTHNSSAEHFLLENASSILIHIEIHFPSEYDLCCLLPLERRAHCSAIPIQNPIANWNVRLKLNGKTTAQYDHKLLSVHRFFPSIHLVARQ